MKKWFLLALVLIPAIVFAAGLRIDFKVLGEKLQKKPDHNAQALLKMGIDPTQLDFKGKPWWTFNPEDNLFGRLSKFNPVKQMSDESWETSQAMKKKLGPSPEEMMQAQAQAMAVQARLNQQMMEQRMQEEQ